VGFLVVLLIGVTGFNTWLLLLARRDVAQLRRELERKAAEALPASPPATAELKPPTAPSPPPEPPAIPASLSAGARVAARFFTNVAKGDLDEAMGDAAENLTRDQLREFHDKHRASLAHLGLTSVDDGDARATVHYADGQASSRFAATAALMGKEWRVIDLSRP
jgi:hypothetical protein